MFSIDLDKTWNYKFGIIFEWAIDTTLLNSYQTVNLLIYYIFMSIKFDEIYFPTIIYIKFVSGSSYLNGYLKPVKSGEDI